MTAAAAAATEGGGREGSVPMDFDASGGREGRPRKRKSRWEDEGSAPLAPTPVPAGPPMGGIYSALTSMGVGIGMMGQPNPSHGLDGCTGALVLSKLPKEIVLSGGFKVGGAGALGVAYCSVHLHAANRRIRLCMLELIIACVVTYVLMHTWKPQTALTWPSLCVPAMAKQVCERQHV